MILVIDAGNTQLKLAVFENNTLILKEFSNYDNWQNKCIIILKKFKKINNIVIASVSMLGDNALSWVDSSIKITQITNQSKFPFKNLYKTPNTLGIDRMVLAAGAVFNYPNINRLIIDAGTCITYDFIDQNNNYFGGAIAPGMQLRYQAMHNYTAKLPLLNKDEIDFIIGNDTNQSIHSGVVNGVVFEIDGFISSFCKQNKNFIIILTGGDADFLAKRLKNTIFANSNFLLESLNIIYQYNTYV